MIVAVLNYHTAIMQLSCFQPIILSISLIIMTFIFYWAKMVISKHKGLFVLKKQVFRLIIIGNSA